VFSDLLFSRLRRLNRLGVLFCSVCMVRDFSVSVIGETALEGRTLCSVKYSVCIVV